MQEETHKGMSTSTLHQARLRLLFRCEALGPDNMHAFTKVKAQSMHISGTDDAVHMCGEVASER